jgi:Cytochrome c554 and c-prime
MTASRMSRMSRGNRGPERGIARYCVLGAALGGLSACAPATSSHSAARSGPRRDGSAPALSLIVSGDTAGWIMPCGCTANQSGGLPRRGSFVNHARADHAVVLADAGGAPGGTSPYDRLKFEAILAGELAMGIVAHNLGAPEAALGAQYLRETGKRLGVPFLSANLRDGDGALIAPASIVVAASPGGKRIMLVGVVSPQLVRGGLKVDEPRAAILAALKGAQEYDALVVLAYLREPELRQLAAELPEADVVVGGPTGQSIAPTRVGPTWLASATNKGKFLIQLNTEGRGTPWTGQVVELSPTFSDDPAQTLNLDRFHGELARRDFAADQTGFVTAPPASFPASYRVAGSAACRACHRDDCDLWDRSKHALAWRTLEGRGLHVDPQCQTCHTTGYGLPGGFQSIARGAERTAVGCESCHGPAEAHVQQPRTRTPFAARDRCVACHDPENSPRFAHDDYWRLIRHGAARAQTLEPKREAHP